MAGKIQPRKRNGALPPLRSINPNRLAAATAKRTAAVAVPRNGGRPERATTTRTRAVANRLASERKTPLEVGVEAYLWFLQRARHYAALARDIGRCEADRLENERIAKGYFLCSADVASRFAMYVHPRLQAVAIRSFTNPLVMYGDPSEAEIAARIEQIKADNEGRPPSQIIIYDAEDATI